MPGPGGIDGGRKSGARPIASKEAVTFPQAPIIDQRFLKELREDIGAAGSDFFVSEGRVGREAVSLRKIDLYALIAAAERADRYRQSITVMWCLWTGVAIYYALTGTFL